MDFGTVKLKCVPVSHFYYRCTCIIDHEALMGSGVTKEKEFLCEKNLEENELADPAKLYVKLFKGSPATNPKNMYDIGYKLGE